MCDVENLKNLLEAFEDRKKEFNVFKELKMYKGSENRHSNMLACFLDPNKVFGDKFLIKFLDQFGIQVDENKKICIIREDSSELGRPDIVITGGVNCVIEVKYGARETMNQCKRYYYNENYGDKYNYIYLTLNDKSYEKVKDEYGKVKDEYGNSFNFSHIYKLATFDKNVIPVIWKCLEEVKDEYIKKIITQYVVLLEEEYSMFEGKYIEHEVIECQKGIEYNVFLNQFDEKYLKKIKGYFNNKRYRIMWLLFSVLKDKEMLAKEYKNFDALTIACNYKGENFTITNDETENDSEIIIKESGDKLFDEEAYNEELFYVYDESEIKKNLSDAVKDIIENS